MALLSAFFGGWLFLGEGIVGEYWLLLCAAIILAAMQCRWIYALGNYIVLSRTPFQMRVRSAFFLREATISASQIERIEISGADEPARWPAYDPVAIWWKCRVRVRGRRIPVSVMVLLDSGEQSVANQQLSQFAEAGQIGLEVRC